MFIAVLDCSYNALQETSAASAVALARIGDSLDQLRTIFSERQQHVDDQLRLLWSELQGLARRGMTRHKHSHGRSGRLEDDLGETPVLSDDGRRGKDSSANYLRVGEAQRHFPVCLLTARIALRPRAC